MRCVALLLSVVLALGVLSSDLKLTDSADSFRALKHEKKVKPEQSNFLVQWSDQTVDGYRIATFDEITTQNFVDEYNKQGIYFDTDDDDDVDVRCSLSVADGLLLYPKNDTENSNLMTLNEGEDDFGCFLMGVSGYAYFETWPFTFCSSIYVGNQFYLLSVPFMKDYFYTAKEKCDDDDTSITMAIFIRDSVTPSPSPTPTPPPTPSSSYVCCGY